MAFENISFSKSIGEKGQSQNFILANGYLQKSQVQEESY